MILHSLEYGSGKPLVILHGLLGSGENWRSIARQLSPQRRVFLPDLRNHGESFHSDEMDYPVMAGDVYRFLQERGAGPAVIIGHSMGGKAAMELALAHPEAVEKLIVVDIAPFRYKPLYSNIFHALTRLDPAQISSRSDAERLLKPDVPDRRVRLFLLKNLKRVNGGGFAWKVNVNALAENYDHIWAEIDMNRTFGGPVLFIEGELSDAGIGERFDEIVPVFPNAELTVINNAGHWVHSEQPAAFLHAVKDFLV